MIISCPNCKKNFKIDPSLIPEDGRDLKCGSCDHVWLYKVQNKISIPLSLKKNSDDYDTKLDDTVVKNDEVIEIDKHISKDITENENKTYTKKFSEQKILVDKKKNSASNFFSYLIVLIISFVALIVVIDTFKIPLINIFPGLEIILFNLFETLKDIKLFIIDL
tara:strand:- start:183 stop:674 length:492 start_codon:yes stop_codon:yes gene_type:complete